MTRRRSGAWTSPIDDDDEPQFTLAASAATVAEGESTIVTVDTGGVTFATAQTIALQLGGTAAAADYTITPASITIAAGQTAGSATIAAVDDTLSEDAETIAIAASHGGTAIGSVEITISASDQTTFSLLLFPDDAAVTEGESATVTVDTGGVSFDVEQTIVLTLTGSATAADDYTITPASITIAAGQTAGSATITTVDDAESEGDETITIAASHEAASIGTRNLTIIDNDADFSLTVIPAAIAEGDDAVVTVDTGGVSFDVEQDDRPDAHRQRDGRGRLHDHACQHHDRGRPDRGQRHHHDGGRRRVGGRRNHHDRGQPRGGVDRHQEPDHHRQRRGLQPDRHPGPPSPRATTPS